MAQVRFMALSERGIQDTNKDSFCAERIGNFSVFAVADGLAGHPAGRIASDIAISSLIRAVRKMDGSPRTTLENAVHDADREIRQQSEQSRERSGMGTQIVACLVDDNLDCTVLDTGDGSIYIINSDGITTPRDHASPETKGRDSHSREQTGQNPPLSKMVSHALGEPRVLKDNDFTELNIRDSFLLLSSDGLYDYVKKDTIQDIVLENGSNLEASCEELIQKALSAGSDGTITVVLVRGEYE